MDHRDFGFVVGTFAVTWGSFLGFYFTGNASCLLALIFIPIMWKVLGN